MTTGLTALSYDCWAQAPPANLKTIMWWKMNERMHSIHAGLILFISASIKHPVCYLWTRSTFRQKVESWTGRSLVKLQESISFIIGFLIHFQNLETDICGTKTGSIFPTLCINKREFHSLVLQTCLRSLKPHCIYSWQNSHVLEKGCADGPTLTKAKSHTHTHTRIAGWTEQKSALRKRTFFSGQRSTDANRYSTHHRNKTDLLFSKHFNPQASSSGTVSEVELFIQTSSDSTDRQHFLQRYRSPDHVAQSLGRTTSSTRSTPVICSTFLWLILAVWFYKISGYFALVIK